MNLNLNLKTSINPRLAQPTIARNKSKRVHLQYILNLSIELTETRKVVTFAFFDRSVHSVEEAGYKGKRDPHLASGPFTGYRSKLGAPEFARDRTLDTLQCCRQKNADDSRHDHTVEAIPFRFCAKISACVLRTNFRPINLPSSKRRRTSARQEIGS